MSGRGGGGRGGRGGWRGRGRGGAPGPVAKDEDGNIIDSTPAGPPPNFPEIELPHRPEYTPEEEELLRLRAKMTSASQKTPFVLEAKENKKEDVDSVWESYQDVSKGGHGAAPLRKKRAREPLTSVIKLLPEFFPEELYSSSDRKFAKLQDTYFKRAGKKDDAGLSHLEALAKREEQAGGAQAGNANEDEHAGEAEEDVHDTDNEEDMEDDDYYQGEQFDDDEGYDDYEDGGGDNEPIF